MKIKLSILLLILSVSAFAQNENEYPSFYGEYFYENDTVVRYIFSDFANVRNDAGIEFEILDKLACGQEVTIFQNTQKEENINGIVAYWYKIHYQKDNQRKEGYLWGGNLSYNQIRRGNVKFVFGLEKLVKLKRYDEILKQENEYYACSAKIKAVKNEKIVSSQKFNIKTNTSNGNGKIINDVHFSTVEFLINLCFGGEACGVDDDDYYFAWNGSEILPFIETSTVADAGIFSYSEQILFSYEMLVKVYNLTEYEEDSATVNNILVPSKNNYKTEIYEWNGKKLTKIEQKWEE